MNWSDAIEAMKRGHQVRRVSEQYRRPFGGADGVPIFECGEEPAMLAHAWTYDERPVMVFRGAMSGALFVPDSDHREATDWEVVP